MIKCALETLNKTKQRTPVDTGDLKGNWYITDVIRKSNDEILVYLYNTKDYASHVEFGHTTRNRTGWVEGYHMATISLQELERKLPARYDREFKKFLKRMGIE